MSRLLLRNDRPDRSGRRKRGGMTLRLTGTVALMAPAVPVMGTAPASAGPGGIRIYTGTGLNHPWVILAGAGGALWTANNENDSIGRISTTGVVTNYTDPTMNGPLYIASGSDGTMWFTNNAGHSIGRITTAGVVSDFTDSTMKQPGAITPGPDGALWFINGDNSIGRITKPGVVS